jgi:hypothetical protein
MELGDNPNPRLYAVAYYINDHDLWTFGSIIPGDTSGASYSSDDIDYYSYSSAETALFSEHAYNYFETDGGKTMQGFIIFLGLCGGVLSIVMIVYYFKACVAAKKVSDSVGELVKINTEIFKYSKNTYELLANRLPKQEQSKEDNNIEKEDLQ